MPFITRKIPIYEVLNEEGLALIEHNADTVLEEVGIDFKGDEEALADLARRRAPTCRASACTFPRGLCRTIIRERAPATYTQHARNPARSVVMGGPHTVFAPAYGPPFVHDLDRGRRYGTIEDFRNFVKLAYMSPWLHHSGGTVCEPVDLPVNKRHLDMVYAHMRYSDKPFMGSVTHPDRAADSVEMAEHPVRRRLDRPRDGPAADGHHQPDQRQLAAHLGRDHARRAESVRAGEPGEPAHPLHPRRRDGAGDGGGLLHNHAGRGDVGHRFRATAQSGRAGDFG